MKKFIVLALLLTFALPALACSDRLAYNMGETEMVEIDGEMVEVEVTCKYNPGGNGIPFCVQDGTCPCMGLRGDFLTNCELQNTPKVEVVTEASLIAQIETLQEELLVLLNDLLYELLLQV